MLLHRNHYWKIWIFWKYNNNIIFLAFKLKITLYAYSPFNVNYILLSS